MFVKSEPTKSSIFAKRESSKHENAIKWIARVFIIISSRRISWMWLGRKECFAEWTEYTVKHNFSAYWRSMQIWRICPHKVAFSKLKFIRQFWMNFSQTFSYEKKIAFIQLKLWLVSQLAKSQNRIPNFPASESYKLATIKSNPTQVYTGK